MKEKSKYMILTGIIALFVVGILYINNKELFQGDNMDITQEHYTDEENEDASTADISENNQNVPKTTSSNNTTKKKTTSSNSTISTSTTERVKYSCLSGFTLDEEKKECYKYTTFESTKTKTCPEGYNLYITDDLQEKCRKYVINDDVMIYTNPHCATNQELSLEDNACLNTDNSINKTQEECNESGYFWSKVKNRCYINKSPIIYYKSCPDGYKMNDSTHCYKYDIIDRQVVKATCPNGYTLSDDKNTCSYKHVTSATKHYSN